MRIEGGQPKAEALVVRDATEADMAAVAAIYGHYVLHGTATFETDPPSAAEMQRRREGMVNHGYPYLVAERGGEILGYAYAGAYRPRPAYWNTVENSIYLRHDAAGHRVGTQLLGTLVQTCEDRGYRQIIAMIGDSENIPSLKLHLRLGFVLLGTLRSVGYKHGRWIDTICMQRSIGLGDQRPPDTEPPQG